MNKIPIDLPDVPTGKVFNILEGVEVYYNTYKLLQNNEVRKFLIKRLEKYNEINNKRSKFSDLKERSQINYIINSINDYKKQQEEEKDERLMTLIREGNDPIKSSLIGKLPSAPQKPIKSQPKPLTREEKKIFKSMPTAETTIDEEALNKALNEMDFDEMDFDEMDFDETGGKKKTKKGKKTKKRRKTKKKQTRSKKKKGGDPPMSPLQAIRAGLVDKVEEMIDSGRDVNQPSQNGFTLLHYAVHFMEKQERLRSAMRMVNMLIEKGADVNSEANGGLTPLHIAAARDNIHLIRLLIEKGADKNKETAVGDTPLIVAAKRDNKDAIKALIDGGVDINHRNNNGETPVFLVSRGLHAALSPSQSYRVLRLLIDSGADIQIENNQGISPLWIATLKGNLNLVYLLLEAGADLESFNAEGRTPLAKAAETGKPRTVELLWDYGAEIESQDNEQNTPLMLAANNGHKDVVKFLIEKDAFVNHKNEEELTAIDLAQREGHLEIVNMLRRHNINNEIRGYKRPNIPSLSIMAYQALPNAITPEVDKRISDPEVGMKRPFSRLGGKRKTKKSKRSQKKRKSMKNKHSVRK